MYCELGLTVSKRRRRKSQCVEREPLLLPSVPNHTWFMDFVMDALSNGRRIKCLAIVDDYTKECLDIPVATGISGDEVVIMRSLSLRFEVILKRFERIKVQNLQGKRSTNGLISMVLF